MAKTRIEKVWNNVTKGIADLVKGNDDHKKKSQEEIMTVHVKTHTQAYIDATISNFTSQKPNASLEEIHNIVSFCKEHALKQAQHLAAEDGVKVSGATLETQVDAMIAQSKQKNFPVYAASEIYKKEIESITRRVQETTQYGMEDADFHEKNKATAEKIIKEINQKITKDNLKLPEGYMQGMEKDVREQVNYHAEMTRNRLTNENDSKHREADALGLAMQYIAAEMRNNPDKPEDVIFQESLKQKDSNRGIEFDLNEQETIKNTPTKKQSLLDGAKQINKQVEQDKINAQKAASQGQSAETVQTVGHGMSMITMSSTNSIEGGNEHKGGNVERLEAKRAQQSHGKEGQGRQ